MDIKQIKDLVQIFGDSSLAKLSIKTNGSEITLEKGQASADSFSAAEISGPSAKADLPAKEDDTEMYLSPMVGTFYASSSEEANAYVHAGDLVKKGQPLCIIEAMKMMNEIDSEYDMQILEVLAHSGQPVEYDQPLFKIKKCKA